MTNLFKSILYSFSILLLTVPNVKRVMAQEGQTVEVQNFDYWAALCTSQKEAKNYEEAIKSCDQAIALNANDAMTWMDKGDAQFALLKYPEAVAAYSQVVRLDPRNSPGWAKQCAGHIELGKLDDAINECETALRIDDKWGEVGRGFALYQQGVALWRLDRRQEALFSFDLAIQSNPNYSLALAQRCDLLFQLGNTTDALKSCDRALDVNGDWGNKTPAIALANKGRILAKLGRYDEALNAYVQAGAIDPKNEVAWTESGEVLYTIGKPAEALTAHEWALKISPNYSLALANKCATLNQLNQYDEALAACEKAIQEGDGRWGEDGVAYAWNQRGNALTGLGRFEEALASTNRAIGLKPNYSDAWSNRGVTLWYLGQFLDALAATEQAIAINPNSSKAWFNHGRILTTLGRYKEATDAYNQALLGDANVGDRLTLAEIWVNISALHWRLEEYPQAIEAADRAIGINPKSAQAWYNRALALMALQRYADAVATYDKAIQIDGTNADFWAGKGIALKFLRQYPESLTALQTALKLNPSHPQAILNLNLVMQLAQPTPVPPPPPTVPASPAVPPPPPPQQ